VECAPGGAREENGQEKVTTQGRRLNGEGSSEGEAAGEKGQWRKSSAGKATAVSNLVQKGKGEEEGA